jgi:hypothetical protein
MKRLIRFPFVLIRFVLVLPYMLHTVASGATANIFFPTE